jgi:transcriptional antiterminator NusG
MWYVIQVYTGSEDKIRLQCQKRISQEILTDCFLPYYEEKRKIQGEWVLQRKILFPGYLFLVTDQIEVLEEQLKQVIGMTRLLKSDTELVPLTEAETQLLLSLGGKDQVVELSEGIIENDQVKILSGPLQNREGMIRKIDRHKRKAWIEVELFGRQQLVQVGVEIVARV